MLLETRYKAIPPNHEGCYFPGEGDGVSKGTQSHRESKPANQPLKTLCSPYVISAWS